ncbi:MAG: hypothetical protein DRI57_10785 [Deltaproteobacteria bacterium]|nr:MAG: hypothetical protein DRI57_10785 [Deltaproteobacteria bacterium]
MQKYPIVSDKKIRVFSQKCGKRLLALAKTDFCAPSGSVRERLNQQHCPQGGFSGSATQNPPRPPFTKGGREQLLKTKLTKQWDEVSNPVRQRYGRRL